MNILIVEDEPLAQSGLKRKLLLCDLEINSIYYTDSVEETVTWLKKNEEPDLIFMDIKLLDGLSFDIFEMVKINAPVIFTTAFDEYAIKAFKVNSIDYLLKPIGIEELKLSLEKFKKLNEKDLNVDLSEIKKMILSNKKNYKTRFISILGNEIIAVNERDICYFYSEEKIVYIRTKRDIFIINSSLEELESQVDPSQYFRLNRKYLSKKTSISKITKHSQSRLKLELTPSSSEEIIVSQKKHSIFLNWLEK